MQNSLVPFPFAILCVIVVIHFIWRSLVVYWLVFGILTAIAQVQYPVRETFFLGFPFLLGGQETACNAEGAGDAGLIPGLGKSPGGGYGNPLQYSCWENSTDRGVWQATIHRVVNSQTRLSEWTHTHVTAHNIILFTLKQFVN